MREAGRPVNSKSKSNLLFKEKRQKLIFPDKWPTKTHLRRKWERQDVQLIPKPSRIWRLLARGHRSHLSSSRKQTLQWFLLVLTDIRTGKTAEQPIMIDVTIFGANATNFWNFWEGGKWLKVARFEDSWLAHSMGGPKNRQLWGMTSWNF